MCVLVELTIKQNRNDGIQILRFFLKSEAFELRARISVSEIIDLESRVKFIFNNLNIIFRPYRRNRKIVMELFILMEPSVTVKSSVLKFNSFRKGLLYLKTF